MSSHALWDEQAHEDFSDAAQALANLAALLDEQTMSWDGITPAEALDRLKQIAAAVEFAAQTARAAAALSGVSGS